MGIPAQHSWCFRNALVRASYKWMNISLTTEFVERFFRNIITGEKNEFQAFTVKSIISGLVEKGIIIRSNGRRNGWWEILSK